MNSYKTSRQNRQKEPDLCWRLTYFNNILLPEKGLYMRAKVIYDTIYYKKHIYL